MEDKEIWVFLSHSQEDYEKVCRVRNLLEQNGFRPLMFFLKCLENAEEIEDLIKREIDSRGRFILCDSKNARASKWVKKEVEYIQTKCKMYQTINIEESEEVIAEKVLDFKKFSTVYISYARQDRVIYQQLLRFLKDDLDFRVNVTSADDLEPGADYAASLRLKMDTALENGYVIFLATENFMKSQGLFCWKELEYALENKKRNNVIILNTNSLDYIKNKYISENCCLREVSCIIEGNKLKIDKKELYFQLMEDSIIERFKLGDKKAKQLLDERAKSFYDIGRKLYYDDRCHENIEKAAYLYLRKAAELGHEKALSLIQNRVWGVDKEME